ncbi:MAG: VWA domain-containing protein [Pirellulaceae bacterium]
MTNNQNEQPISKQEQLDADLTAFALGQLPENEAETIRQYLVDHPQATQRVNELRQLNRVLLGPTKDASIASPQVTLAHQSNHTTRSSSSRRRFGFLLATTAALVVVGISLAWWNQTKQLRDDSLAMNGKSLQSEALTKNAERHEQASGDTSDQAAEATGKFETKLSTGTPGSSANVPEGGTVLLGGVKRDAQQDGQSLAPDESSVIPNVKLFSNSGDERQFRDQMAASVVGGGAPGLEAEENISLEPSRPSFVSPSRVSPDNDRNGEVDGRWYGGGFGGRNSDGKYEETAGETYAHYIENEFTKPAGQAALSTFAIDVDTASYANMRRFLSYGQLPPPDSVRIEELINYFEYNYPDVDGDDPFSSAMQLSECPWNPQHQLLRVALHGREMQRDQRPASNIVFLVDVSGSMNDTNKLPLLKRGLQMMVRELGENDSISLVTYAGNAGVRLLPTNGSNQPEILQAIEDLESGGSTNGSAGIEMAYELARRNFISEGVNRVILATDGDLNVGVVDDSALKKLITEQAATGIFLTVLGFGTGNYQDAKLETLADNGNGNFAYIDGIREAQKVLIGTNVGQSRDDRQGRQDSLSLTRHALPPIAWQGLRNRVMEAKDFRNDAKDAGEIGAGHTVTALYEIVPAGVVANDVAAAEAAQELKYQPKAEVQQEEEKVDSSVQEIRPSQHSDELLTLRVRYKEPDGETAKELEFPFAQDAVAFPTTDRDFQFASAVAAFGQILRNSKHAGSINLQGIEEIATSSVGEDPHGYRAEFVELIRTARGLLNH